MRRDGRVDANQAEIVKKLRELGVSVWILSSLGHVPDLLVGYGGITLLLEVKNKDGRGVKLTEAEQKFFDTWRGGPAKVVTGIDEALALLDCTLTTE